MGAKGGAGDDREHDASACETVGVDARPSFARSVFTRVWAEMVKAPATGPPLTL